MAKKKAVLPEDAPVEEPVSIEKVDRWFSGPPKAEKAVKIVKPVVIPEDPSQAALILDNDRAADIFNAVNRPESTFDSIQIAGQGLSERQAIRLSAVALRALRPGGALFIPAELAALEFFQTMQPKRVDGFEYFVVYKQA